MPLSCSSNLKRCLVVSSRHPNAYKVMLPTQPAVRGNLRAAKVLEVPLPPQPVVGLQEIRLEGMSTNGSDGSEFFLVVFYVLYLKAKLCWMQFYIIFKSRTDLVIKKKRNPFLVVPKELQNAFEMRVCCPQGDHRVPEPQEGADGANGRR